jgi:hypothetical protein
MPIPGEWFEFTAVVRIANEDSCDDLSCKSPSDLPAT